jgi:hypothetical protein
VTAPAPEDLAAKAEALALAAIRDEGEVDRRAVRLREPETAWSAGLLRLVREDRFAVYEHLADVEVTLDPWGRLLGLEDPRNAPETQEAHITENDAIATIASLAGLSRDALVAEYTRTRAGGKAVTVRTKPPRLDRHGKPRPQDEVHAEVNAKNGRVYRFRYEPAPPEPPEGEGEGAGGEGQASPPTEPAGA